MQQQLDSALETFAAFLQSEHPAANRPANGYGADNIVAYLRGTPLPFISCYFDELGATGCFDYSFKFLHLLGRHNLALSVGLCMNQYIAFSIACLPTVPGSTIHALKTQFLGMVKANRWILAVSSFDDFLRNKNDAGHQVKCVTQPNGAVLCNGVKNFQSNISRADVLLFSGILDSKNTGLFYTPLKNVAGITFGDPVFAGAMADADTRSVTFDNLLLCPAQVIPADADAETQAFHGFTRVVFAAMAMAPYLGGAKRALKEASAFLRSVHTDGQPLSALDGYVVDMGRANIDYDNCYHLVNRFSWSLGTLHQDSLHSWLDHERNGTAALKHHVTRVCEDLVDLSRRVIGTRSMMPSNIISLLSQQILFGALHPEVNAKIEREFGRRALSE